MKRKFKVLYTHQKTKKKKIWQDGVLTVPVGGSRAFLCDETNRQISAVYLNKKIVKNGIDLESDKYLIQVEEEKIEVKSENSFSKAEINKSSLNQEEEPKLIPVFSKVKKVKRSGFVVPRRTTLFESSNHSKSQVILKEIKIKAKNTKTSSIWTSNISSDDSDGDSSVYNTPKKLLGVPNTKRVLISNQNNTNNTIHLINSEVKNLQQSNTKSSNADIISKKKSSILCDTEYFKPTNNKNIKITNSNSNRIKSKLQYTCPMSINDKSRKKVFIKNNDKVENQQRTYQSKKDKLKDLLESKLVFPTFKQCKLNRDLQVSPESPPMAYETLDLYLQFWCKYTTRSINEDIFEKATSYYELMESADMRNCILLSNSYTSKLNINQYKVKINNTRSLISYLRRGKINVFVNCTLKRVANVDTEDQETQSVKKQLFALEFSSQESCLVKCKGSYFAVSNSLNFAHEDTFVAKSVSNFDKNTFKLILEPKVYLDYQYWNTQNGLFVIHLTKNFNDDYYEVINKYLSRSPIYKQITNPQATVHKKKQLMDEDLLKKIFNNIRIEYKIDEDQQQFFSHLLKMFGENCDKPYITVNGFTGTGKTYLLSIAIIYLHKVFQSSLFKELKNSYKILVITKDSSSANKVALLLKKQMKEFVLFGNLQDIPADLLPFSFNSSGGASQNIRILKELLRKTTKTSIKHYLETSIDQLINGLTKQLLHNAFAVIASIDQVFANMLTTYKFQLVIFDDCESMSELQSSAILARYRVQNVIMFVDTFSSDLQDTTFFNRLMKNKASYHIKLTTQYKFNPKITAILNNVFDDNILKDGEKTKSLKKILKDIPSFCIYESLGNELDLFDGNYANESEAALIGDLLNYIVMKGIPGTNVLVCTATISQIKYIKSSIEKISIMDRSDLKCVEVTSMENIKNFNKQIVICSFVRSTSNYSKFICEKKWLISLLCSGRNHVIFVGNCCHLSSFTHISRIRELTASKKNVYSSFNIKKLWKKLDYEKISNANDEVPLIACTSENSESFSSDENDDDIYEKLRHQMHEEKGANKKIENNLSCKISGNKYNNYIKTSFQESEKTIDQHLMEYKTPRKGKSTKSFLQISKNPYQTSRNDVEKNTDSIIKVEQQGFLDSSKSSSSDKCEIKEHKFKVCKRNQHIVNIKDRSLSKVKNSPKDKINDCTKSSKFIIESASDHLPEKPNSTFFIDSNDDIDCDFNLDKL